MSTAATIPDGLPDEVRLDPKKSLTLLQVLVGVTLLAGVGLGVGYSADNSPGKSDFWYAYLVGFTLALDVSLGALFWNQIHHVADAGWSVGIRRTFENMTRTIPVLAVLFVPLAVQVANGEVAPWRWVPGDIEKAKVVAASRVADPEHPTLSKFEGDIKTPEGLKANAAVVNENDKLWFHKYGYSNRYFFLARFAAYFGVWIGLSVLQRKLSLEQDRTGNPLLSRRMRGWAFGGTALLGVTATFAAFDLLMSLNPHWFSTMFGVYFWAGGFRGSLATLVLLILALRAAGYLRDTVTIEHLHDAAKIMFGLTVFWTYIAFSQYFLIWYGNIPEETVWYLRRREGLWFTLSVLLPCLYFVAPFWMILPQKHKRTPWILATTASLILFMHLYDLYWVIMPEKLASAAHFPEAVTGVSSQWPVAVEGWGRNPETGPDVRVDWKDVTSVVFFFGTLLSCTVYGMRSEPLIPVRDPRLQESLGFKQDLV